VQASFKARGRPFPATMMGSLGHVVTDAFPELRDQRPFYDLVAKELWTNGLMNTDSLHTTMSGSGLAAGRLSDIGKRFIQFVKAPKPGK
jgi:hypothetical protein